MEGNDAGNIEKRVLSQAESRRSLCDVPGEIPEFCLKRSGPLPTPGDQSGFYLDQGYGIAECDSIVCSDIARIGVLNRTIFKARRGGQDGCADGAGGGGGGQWGGALWLMWSYSPLAIERGFLHLGCWSPDPGGGRGLVC